MQIFIAMDVREVPSFQKTTSMCQGIFSHPVEVTGFMYLMKYFSSFVYLKDLYKSLKEIEISKRHRSLD